MISKLDIRKMLQSSKSIGKKERSFDQGLIGLGVKFNIKGVSK